MASDLEMYKVEETVKQEFLEIVKNLSHVELRRFNKNEYKKKALNELSKLLAKYEKSKLTETAQCIANALQSDVPEQLRKRTREYTPSKTESMLSNTILKDLDMTLGLDETENENEQSPTREQEISASE